MLLAVEFNHAIKNLHLADSEFLGQFGFIVPEFNKFIAKVVEFFVRLRRHTFPCNGEVILFRSSCHNDCLYYELTDVNQSDFMASQPWLVRGGIDVHTDELVNDSGSDQIQHSAYEGLFILETQPPNLIQDDEF